MKHRIAGILSIALVALTFSGLFSGCGILPEEEEPTAPPLVQPKRQEYELVKAERKDITNYVKGLGSLEAAEQVQLFFKQSGKRLKSINVTYGQKVEKGAVVASVDSEGIQSKISLQQIEIEKIKLQLDSLRKQYQANMSLAPQYRPPQKTLEEMEESIKLKELDLKSAGIMLDDLKKEYELSVLTAPISGQVTFIENIKEGDTVEAYKTLITISDPSRLDVYYQSDDTIKVKTGMKAEVYINKTRLEGRVVLSPDNAPQESNPKFRNAVIIKVDNMPDGVKMGDFADISIPVESKTDTIVIPKKALQSFFGVYVVRVLENDSKKEVEVKVGITNTEEAEILSGISEGQMVIVD